MKHGLRIGAASSQLIQNNRREIEKEKTLMEKQLNFKYRDYPSDEYTLLQNAQRKGWNGYHAGSLQNSKKKNQQLGPNAPNAPDHRGRMTSPERR